jgi:hypothetical protein
MANVEEASRGPRFLNVIKSEPVTRLRRINDCGTVGDIRANEYGELCFSDKSLAGFNANLPRYSEQRQLAR